MSKDVNQYQQVSAHGGVAASDPHQLILLLMNGALDAIAVAKGHMRRNEVAEKGSNISRAISIIDGLRGSLDHSVGGELAVNLDELYRYMGQRLLQANVSDSAEWLDEVTSLLREIREAWEQVPQELRKIAGADGDGASVTELASKRKQAAV
ncbi:MAG: flagellar export chaperone FliS [Gammaproteobacteria bacterium]|nr:flagellar export chaperone FliS [Gammaproteobacteria bacterium]